MTNTYTIEEVTRHNRAKDLWIVIHGKVYDLTMFLKEHPGGEEILLHLAGQDGTKCFDEIGHSAEAIMLRDKFQIGEIRDDTSTKVSDVMSIETENSTTNDDDWKYREIKESSWFPMIVGAAVVIYAIIFYYIWF